jgi:polysaccharide chain length determinant protein (PEP-CTERM system associated)
MLGHRALNVEDYLAILKRRWWIIVIPAILLPIFAVAATYFIKPEYLSQSLVLIDQQKVPSEFVKPVDTEDLNNRLARMKEEIFSRSTLQPIIEKYNLYASQHMDMDARLDLARKAINVLPIQSDIARANGLPGFKVSFTADDPRTAQQVCSDITSLFTAADLRARAAAAGGTTDFLKEQLDQAKATLDDQEAKLATFESQHIGMLPSDAGNNLQILNSLNSQLEAATQSVQQMEQSQSMMNAMLAQQSAASSTSSAAVKSPMVQEKDLEDLEAQEAALSAHYTDNYPDLKEVRRKIADLQKQMAKAAAAPPPTTAAAPPINRPDPISVQQLRAQLRGVDLAIQEKRKQQEQIQAQIRGYQGRISASPQVEEQYKQLTRDSQTAQAFYDKLLTEQNQSKMTSALENRQQGETFSVLDAANLPDSPTFPKQSVFAGGGLGAGIAFGVLIVALLEYRDTALRTERDVWAFTQLPTLAVIAWSGDMAEKGGRLAGLKRLFSRRKEPKELLADGPG